jgi:hypothetical protein
MHKEFKIVHELFCFAMRHVCENIMSHSWVTVSNPLCCCCLFCFVLFLFLVWHAPSCHNSITTQILLFFLLKIIFFGCQNKNPLPEKKTKNKNFFSTEFLWFHFLFVCWPILNWKCHQIEQCKWIDVHHSAMPGEGRQRLPLGDD